MTTMPPLSGPMLALEGAALDLGALAGPLLVRSGALNLFAEQPGGRRSFLFQCGAGELVFGLPAMAGHRVVALGTLGTEVMQLTAGAVDALEAPQRAALLAGWLDRIGAAAQSSETRQLAVLHQEAVERLARTLEHEQAQRAALLARSWNRCADAVAAALGALAQVVRTGGGAAPAPAAPAESEALRAAAAPPQQPQQQAARPPDSPAARVCRRVAAAMRTDFVLPPGVPDDAPLDELLVLAGIRRRTVLLRGRWWNADNGPLVGFDAQREPLALLPVRGGYRAVDADGAGRDVDAALAASLAPDALMLYRPLRQARLDGGTLLRFCARGLSRDAAALLLVGLAAAVLGLLMPLATAWLVGSVIPHGALDQHWQLVGLLVAGTLGAAGFELCKAFLLLRCEARIDLALQAALFDRLLRLPVRFFRRFSVADLADRALGVQEMRTILAVTVPGALLGGVFSVTSLAAMFHYGPGLALAGLAPVALVAGLTLFAGRRQLHHHAEQVRLRGTVEALVLQFVLGVGKLRAAAAEPRALAAWAGRYREQVRRFAFARRGLMVQELVQGCAPPLASLLVFGLVWQALRSGAALPPAQVLAFLAAYGQLLAALTGVTLALTRALEVVPLWRRLRPLIDQAPENAAGRQAPATLTGAIALHEVSFRYDERGPAILDRVSLSIGAGQFVAIVGPSGSGKSTLLRLLMGFEAPASGTVSFDGVPLEQIDAAALRRRIGAVLQTGRISAGSIFDNIAGGQRISHAQALEAARQVGFAHEIEAMPMGLHTVLQEGGGTLSGGQRQRLLLARALARQPAFLLLDEATSALDNRTQATLMESLSRLALTRVMVAHRLSTVIAADQIVVVDGGRIVQRGTYQELIAQPGLFAELARRQLL